MPVIRWLAATPISAHLITNYKVVSPYRGLLTAGQAKTSAGTRTSSQRYHPHNLAIRREGMTQSSCTAATGRKLQQGSADRTRGRLPGAKIGVSYSVVMG